MTAMPLRMRLLVLSGVLSVSIIGGSAIWLIRTAPPTDDWRLVEGLL
ncbi:MAG: hypothetical protein RL625_1010, partial [Gemmatimonadota bacterium]